MSEEENVSRAVRFIAEQSIDKASQSLSKMLRTGAMIQLKRIDLTDIADATERVNAQTEEVIGSFVELTGDAPFKFLFYVQTEGAYALTDLLLRRAIGTTKTNDIYVSSTIQEIGNILAAAVCNVFSNQFQVSLKPQPPIVLNDFAGSMFQELIMEAAAADNKIFLMESRFEVMKVDLPCQMFILPLPGSYKVLQFAGGEL